MIACPFKLLHKKSEGESESATSCYEFSTCNQLPTFPCLSFPPLPPSLSLSPLPLSLSSSSPPLFPCLSNSSYNYIFHSLPIESPSFSSPCTSSTQQTGSFTLINISLFLQVYVIQDLFCSERKELQEREREREGSKRAGFLEESFSKGAVSFHSPCQHPEEERRSWYPYFHLVSISFIPSFGFLITFHELIFHQVKFSSGEVFIKERDASGKRISPECASKGFILIVGSLWNPRRSNEWIPCCQGVQSDRV